MSVTESTGLTPIGTWDEPAGATPRGTLVLLPGRGETVRSYERFGRRLAADAYRVRLVPVDLDHVAATHAAVADLLADDTLPRPWVLVGADTGATLVAALAGELPVDAAVVAGQVLPGSARVTGWDDELDARSACPVHRRVIGDDAVFERGLLARELPAELATTRFVLPPGLPALVLYGAVDMITPAAEAVAPYVEAPYARVRLVDGGRHDVLNDVSHRSVAAEVVLFLESLRLGPELPRVLTTPAGAR